MVLPSTNLTLTLAPIHRNNLTKLQMCGKNPSPGGREG